MKNDLAISVIVPMYNVEKYIMPCLDSILNQTFKNFEIILVDDASSDNCYNLCNERFGNYERVNIIRHDTNKGVGLARNTGMEAARGKYIYFVDSDDIILPNTLDTLYKIAEEQKAEVVHTSYWYEYYDVPQNVSNELKIGHDGEPKLGFLTGNSVERIINEWCNGKTADMAWLKFYNRKFLLENDLKFPAMLHEDQTFALSIVTAARRFFKIPQALYIYRKRENSICRTPPSDLKHISDLVESMIIGTNYVYNVMEKIFTLAEDKVLQNHIMSVYLNSKFPMEYFYPEHHYNLNGNIGNDFDNAVSKALKNYFGDNTFVVKYLFHNFNFLKLSNKLLMNENKMLRDKILGGGDVTSAAA